MFRKALVPPPPPTLDGGLVATGRSTAVPIISMRYRTVVRSVRSFGNRTYQRHRVGTRHACLIFVSARDHLSGLPVGLPST